MSVEDRSFRDLLERRVVLHPVLRVGLAILVIACGAMFAFIGYGMLFLPVAGKPAAPTPTQAAMAVFIAFLGLCFLWVGLRFASPRAATHALLSPVARRRGSVVVGALAVFMIAGAFEADSLMCLACGLGLVVFSFWMFPRAESKPGCNS